VGTAAGDRLLAEAEADPEFAGFEDDNDVDDGMDEAEAVRRKARALDGAIGQMNRNCAKADKMINQAEKAMGLRVKPLVDYEDEEEEAKADPAKDLEIFEMVVQHTYGELKKRHRGVVDSLRADEFETFSRVTASRASARPSREADAPYDRIEEGVRKMKDKLR